MKNKKLIGILIILSFLISFLTPVVDFSKLGVRNVTDEEQNPNLSTIQEEDFTVEWGDNIYQNIPYWYKGTFYESTNYAFAYSNAKLELEYIPDNSVYYNETITDSFENSEIQYPTNESISIINGTHYQNGTLNSLDDDYHIFKSTTSTIIIPEQPSNFTLINGTSNFEGNLEYIDSNYTKFNSTESGHYPASYSFEEDDVGGDPVGWDVNEGTGTTANVISNFDGHNKVLELYDNHDSNNVEVSTLLSQTSGTIEFWWGVNDATDGYYFNLLEGASILIHLRIFGDKIQYADPAYVDLLVPALDNTWYHIKIDFELGDEEYMGLDPDHSNFYINGDLTANCPMRNTGVTADSISFYTTVTHVDQYLYIDAVGGSWYANYTIGDNEDPIPALINFNVDLNLDSFSNLDDLNLVYSYRTNISQTCNFSIYNFDNSEYDLIESAINETFNNCYFELNSSYYNATNDLILKSEMSNTTNDFRFELERLVIRHSSYLNFTTYVNFEILTNLLQLDIKSYQRSNISQLINISTWDWDNEEWDLLYSSSYTTTFQLADYSSSTAFDEYIDNSTGQVLLSYYGVSKTDNFEFHLDKLELKTWRKTTLSFEKTLKLLGTWKYRFHLDIGLGSAHTSDWIYFNIIEQHPNFEGISESKYTTKWVLTSTASSGTRNSVWEDDLTSNSWYLTDYSDDSYYITTIATKDAWTDVDNPTVNHGTTSPVKIQSIGSVEKKRSYFYIPDPDSKYMRDNTTGLPNSMFHIYVVYDYPTSGGTIVLNEYTGSFDETAINWNNQLSPTTELYSGSADNYQDEWIDLPTFSTYNNFVLRVTSAGYEFHYVSREAGFSYQKPFRLDYFNKKYQSFSSGYVYMQTDSTEVLGLKSPTYSDTSLSEGDLFVVDLQTTSDNAQLMLYDNGVLQKTITILTANVDYDRQDIEVYIDSDVTFDQVKITSSLTDTEYLKLYDIKADHWTFSQSEDQRIMYVNPFGKGEIIANLGNNSLKIYENNILQTNSYIYINYDLTTYIFQSPLPETVFVSFYDTNNDFLNFNDFKVYVNYTLDEIIFSNQRLTSNEFFVDEETTIYFDVYDSFDVSIYSAGRLAETFIDIDLTVYSLKIKNEKLVPVEYKLKNNDTEIIKSGYLFENEILEYKIASGTYIFEYLKEGESEWGNFTFSFTSNQIFVLNRSKICFLSYSNQRAEYLEFNNYKTYINGTLLYENIFYRDIGVDIGIEIKDRYGISIKNESYVVISGDNYIPIILTEYSLKVMNQQEIFNHINITRDPNYYESPFSWSEWVAPNEIIKFRLFPGYYKINLTDNEGGSSSFYEYTLNGDDILLISSDNILSQVIYNIANVNTTIGNQITNVEINITNQNSQINNTIVNIEINLSNVNSTLGNLLTNIDLDIINLQSDINSLYTFTNTSIWNLNNAMNSSFIYMENNIYSINQSISTLVIGIDNSISLVNATITSMFTEMNQQFIVVQSTLDYSFAFLNQTIIQLANDITENHVILYNLIEQRANDINSSLINVQTLINLVNNTVADESLVIQTLVNLIGANITNNHIIINNLLNLIDNNITNNNIQLVSILEVIGNNITTNHFVIQTLLDVIGNNITYNHIEMLTNLNLINTTISQNQIELINRLLFINNTVNVLMFELTNQLLFLNGTIYNAVLNLSTSVEFGVDMVIGNITITYQQNEFLTELYKETMFSQLLNWSGVAYNYTLMEDRIDVWEFINNYRNDSIQVLLRYNDLIDNLTISAQNTIEQYLPNEDVEYRLKSVATGEYLSKWEELPENKTVSFGFYETEVPSDPRPLINAMNMLVWFAIFVIFILFIIIVLYVRFKKEKASIPIELRRFIKQKKKKSNIKKNGYSDKDIYID